MSDQTKPMLPGLPVAHRSWPYEPVDGTTFSRDQVRAIQLATWKAAMEHAARICDHFKDHALAAQTGSDSLEEVMLRQVAVLGMGECAAAIRQAPEPGEGGCEPRMTSTADPQLICQRCKVDRYKQPCGDPHSGACPMRGTTDHLARGSGETERERG